MQDDGYDNGWRRGTFDKCNGLDEKVFDEIEFSEYNIGYVMGYQDAFDTNERKV